MLTDLQATIVVPNEILERRLIKKGNTAIHQLLVSWTDLLSTSATWEDYDIVKHRYPDELAWGQLVSSVEGAVTTQQ